MTTLKKMGVLAHPLRPQTHPVAESIAESLRARGVESWVYVNWNEREVQGDVETAEMVVAIGGDGAMLRAARVCAPYRVPVLGYNMGQLGFLTEIAGPDQWEQDLKRVLEGQYWIEERMMLSVTVLRAGLVVTTGEALNDVVVSGSMVGRMIQLEMYIDQHWATNYHADALIIATPTGSTAYALACGGPILPPELHNILVVPAAPHLSMDRPIVLSEGARVEISASSSSKNDIAVIVDGTVLCLLRENDLVRVQASDHSSRFVRLRERNYFYRSVLDRLEPRVPRSAPEKRQKL